jgi:hypothetical protein
VDDNMFFSPFLIPIVATFGAFAYLIIKTLSYSRIRELEIRERIAMVERGLVPPPEVDPRGFDREMDRHARRYDRQYRRFGSRSMRHRRSGVTVMGIGFGLMVLIAFAGGEPNVAIGVGGAILILGLAFFINGMLDTSDDPPVPYGQRYASSTPPPGAPAPPVAAPPPSDHRVD